MGSFRFVQAAPCGLDDDHAAEGRSTRTARGRSAAEDGRAATFLLRDAKPLAAAEKSRRPSVAGRRSGRSPYPSVRSGHRRTQRVGLIEERQEATAPSTHHGRCVDSVWSHRCHRNRTGSRREGLRWRVIGVAATRVLTPQVRWIWKERWRQCSRSASMTPDHRRRRRHADTHPPRRSSSARGGCDALTDRQRPMGAGETFPKRTGPA
jgi:hypothetical protein